MVRLMGREILYISVIAKCAY